MATNPTFAAPQNQREDPLLHLSSSSILEYQRGQTIYSGDQPPTDIYLVIDGTVRVRRMAQDGRPVVVDIYHNDEFFGESAILNLPRRNEEALALENTKVMAWTTAEIEDVVMRRPRLAIALLQIFVQRSIEFGCRIESFAADNIDRRLARRLIRFSDRLGQNTERWFGSDDAVYARTLITVRRHLARDRNPLHEPTPPRGLPAIFPQRNLPPSRRVEELVRATSRLSPTRRLAPFLMAPSESC